MASAVFEPGQPHLVVVPQFAHGAEKRLQPAFLVQPFPRARPATELLAVVTQDRKLAAGTAESPEVVGEFGGRTKWDEVAQLLVDGEDRDAVPARLRDEVSMKLIARES